MFKTYCSSVMPVLRNGMFALSFYKALAAASIDAAANARYTEFIMHLIVNCQSLQARNGTVCRCRQGFR